jgi:hypothetical protein
MKRGASKQQKALHPFVGQRSGMKGMPSEAGAAAPRMSRIDNTTSTAIVVK